jgi:serine protease
LKVTHRFQRIDAETVRIARKDIPLLAHDSNVAFVEEDVEMRLLTETVPWGISAVQADTTVIPPPDTASYRPGEPCFKICIVDSGMHLGHNDLVSFLPPTCGRSHD